MKPLTDRGARAAVRRLKAESAAGAAIHSYKDVADLAAWAERILARRRRSRRVPRGAARAFLGAEERRGTRRTARERKRG